VLSANLESLPISSAKRDKIDWISRKDYLQTLGRRLITPLLYQVCSEQASACLHKFLCNVNVAPALSRVLLALVSVCNAIANDATGIVS